ncbi:RcpC/CpaB family pilus assembly protein [Streptomyces sp. S465]|uniref:RcpC/CpaB family pilus assembly protein n=1 Tax=Streptomyces sp. S465 TaxID=2979468 RepID=UPI0022A8B5DE|nr:RcpC/CpaB family pilus assembly protein [Streptomyces sp. S465]WAP57861.1 RcpC/CpaB family pilus assembly protein [Streptomyces sp. S465]
MRTGRDGGFRLGRAMRRRRRAMAAGLALTAAALAAAAPSGKGHTDGVSSPPAPAREDPGGAPRPVMVSAPVRIADAAAVRLLHPGDRVDVLATPLPDAARTRSSGSAARVVARGVRVAEVPGARGSRGIRTADDGADGGTFGEGADGGGALVVLTVPRADATALAGAAAGSRLAVTLCRC